MKFSRNEASNVYLELIIFGSMGHKCAHLYNCQTELVTFKLFLTNGSSPGYNLDHFHSNTLHTVTILKTMRIVNVPLPTPWILLFSDLKSLVKQGNSCLYQHLLLDCYSVFTQNLPWTFHVRFNSVSQHCSKKPQTLICFSFSNSLATS